VPWEQSLFLPHLQHQRFLFINIHEDHLRLQLRQENDRNVITTEAEERFWKLQSVQVPQERSSSPNPMETEKKQPHQTPKEVVKNLAQTNTNEKGEQREQISRLLCTGVLDV